MVAFIEAKFQLLKNSTVTPNTYHRRTSESDVQCVQCLVAGQQRNANCRALESESHRVQRLAACQQHVADRRASESEAQREQCLTAGQ